MESMSMTNFDFDVNCNRVQSLCTGLLKAANVRAGVQKAFVDLPDSNILPDYYDIIQLPISLSMIKESISKGLYTSLYHCYTDLLIMCLNAKTYNEPHTEIYDMSLEVLAAIKKHMTSTKMADKSLRTAINSQYKFIDYKPDQKKTKFNNDLFVDFWNMFCQAVSRCNKSGRPITSAFLCLPDRETLPLYYQEVKNPISLCKIRSKIIACKYETIMDLTSDVSQMCDNAIHFNTKSSVISKDAVSLKDFVNSLAQAYIKEESETAPEVKSPTSKIGEKRKAGGISRSKTPSKDDTSSPAVKKEKVDKSLAKSPATKKDKSAQKASPAVKKEKVAQKCPTKPKPPAPVTVVEEETSVEYLVFTCFTDLKDKGSEIQSEMIRIYSHFYSKIDSIVDFEEILETTEDCRSVLLKVVCGMSSRIDPLCPEFETIERILLRLVKADPDSKKLFGCMPTYFYESKKYFLQEELMTLFRHTPYSSILSHNTNVTRIAKQKKDLRENIPTLDVLSEDIVLVDFKDVWRTLQTPLLDRLIKPSTPSQQASSPKTPAKATVIESTIKTAPSPKTQTQRTPKPKTPKTPKSAQKKTDVKAEVIEGVAPVKTPSNKKAEASKAKARMVLNHLKLCKDASRTIMFDDFFSIPRSKSYHSVIKYPMSLEVIEQGLDTGTISTIDTVVSSCLLIAKNARYYNEEKSELYDRALQLQRVLFKELRPGDSSETTVLAVRAMVDIVEELGNTTQIEELTQADCNSKFVNISFWQFRENVESGYYTRLDRFQDELLHMIINRMNQNQFTPAGTDLLGIMRKYLEIRDKITCFKSAAFDLTMEKFLAHFQDRLDVQIPHVPITCLTYQNASYMVGDKVTVSFCEDDRMILHIISVNSPCWLAGTVYFEDGDTMYKTDIKDIVHVKYVTGKVTKRFRFLSYNYRTRMTSDIVTNKSNFYIHTFNSIFALLSTSRHSTQTIVHGTSDQKTYYLQYARDNGDIFKVGDFVYLKSENELPYIARIDKIHKDKKNHVWVYGPWFIRPSDTRFYETKAYFPNEVLMSSITDMNHINSVEGRCEILSSKDYTTRHPLSFLEKDVYICDNKYDESTHKFSKLTEAKLYLNESITNAEQNEWYIYPTPKRVFRTTKPSFLKPVQVETFTSSEEEETDSEVEFSSTKPATPRPTANSPASTPLSAPRQNTSYQGIGSKIIRPPGTQISRSNLESRIVVNNAIAINNKAAIGHVVPRPPQNRARATTVHVQSPLVTKTNQHSHLISPMVSKAMYCLWENCKESFTDNNEFYSHVINTQTHLSSKANHAWKCRWGGCTNREAKTRGCESQILLRRHVLSHMAESGFSHPPPASRPQILRHTETYKNFLKKLIVQKQTEQSVNMTVLED